MKLIFTNSFCFFVLVIVGCGSCSPSSHPAEHVGQLKQDVLKTLTDPKSEEYLGYRVFDISSGKEPGGCQLVFMVDNKLSQEDLESLESLVIPVSSSSYALRNIEIDYLEDYSPEYEQNVYHEYSLTWEEYSK